MYYGVNTITEKRTLVLMLKLLKKLLAKRTKYTVIRVWEIEAMSMYEAMSIAHFRKHNRITVLKDKKVILGGYEREKDDIHIH